MSLPPGFLEELRNRLSLGQVVGRKVMWDQRKSNQGKGDLWAPCPFHQEKSASFHVDDRKGFYYCFGCHAKGDAISFVRETENVGFMEAVQILAGEAGMPMPERDPRAQQKADERTELAEVMEQSVQHFRLNLQTAAAGEARDYLQRRGLSPEAQARWDIGFAPENGGVLQHLTGKGVEQKKVIDAGLAAESDRGGSPYDRFRDRIIFPIRDARGRAIALGGRAMAADARAKYLNSPETLLFDKSRTLYNHGPAREAAGKSHPLIVAEGYMDVIALSEAGFLATVAPLGTAVTEHHLVLLWRMADEPIIALDGDTAGLRAAMRTIDIALPLLEAGKSLRFAMMPDGQDPDDVLKSQGKAAMQVLIDGAIPMVQLLWQRETEGKSFDSPERKAALDKALREKIKLIQDPSIRNHYGQAIKDMRWELFSNRRQPTKGQGGQWRNSNKPAGPLNSSKTSALAAGQDNDDLLHEAVILATILSTPSVLHDFESDLDRLESRDPDHQQLREAILRHAASDDLRSAVSKEIDRSVLEKLFAQGHVRLGSGARKPGDLEFAQMCLAESFAKLFSRRSQPREIDDAMSDISGEADEGLTWRLKMAAEAVGNAEKIKGADSGEFEKADNGALVDRDEKGSFDELLSRIKFGKGGNQN